jgi:DNA-binding GntR family transcriptional regulator
MSVRMTSLQLPSPPRPGRNLTHGLLDTVGRAIVTGAYDGVPFPTEAQLTEHHGVSRSVTREALKMLTAKGLLSARARVGTVVQPPASWNLFDTDVLRWLLERTFSVDLLRQFTELRIAIEPEAAALAARHAEPHQLDQIRHGLERMRRAETGIDDPLDADIAFHQPDRRPQRQHRRAWRGVRRDLQPRSRGRAHRDADADPGSPRPHRHRRIAGAPRRDPTPRQRRPRRLPAVGARLRSAPVHNDPIRCTRIIRFLLADRNAADTVTPLAPRNGGDVQVCRTSSTGQ